MQVQTAPVRGTEAGLAPRGDVDGAAILGHSSGATRVARRVQPSSAGGMARTRRRTGLGPAPLPTPDRSPDTRKQLLSQLPRLGDMAAPRRPWQRAAQVPSRRALFREPGGAGRSGSAPSLVHLHHPQRSVARAWLEEPGKKGIGE